MNHPNYQVSSQKGFGFFSFFVILPAFLFIFLIGMKCYPMFLEKIKVDQILSSAESKRFESGMSVKKFALYLETQFQLDGVNQLRRKSIEKLLSVKNLNSGRQYTLNYPIQVELFEGLRVIYDYEKSIILE